MQHLNCRIDLNFKFEHSVPCFSYFLKSCSPGWQVSEDGNIRPPPRGRVIAITLNPDSKATMYGIRFSTGSDDFPDNPESERYFNNTGGQAEVIQNGDSKEMIFRLADQHQLLYYQLGVKYDNEVIWDDPRLYNDGSQ